jgi:hypothetical protein
VTLSPSPRQARRWVSPSTVALPATGIMRLAPIGVKASQGAAGNSFRPVSCCPLGPFTCRELGRRMAVFTTDSIVLFVRRVPDAADYRERWNGVELSPLSSIPPCTPRTESGGKTQHPASARICPRGWRDQRFRTRTRTCRPLKAQFQNWAAAAQAFGDSITAA